VEVAHLEAAQEVVQEGHQDPAHLGRSKNLEESDMSTLRAEEAVMIIPNTLTWKLEIL